MGFGLLGPPMYVETLLAGSALLGGTTAYVVTRRRARVYRDVGRYQREIATNFATGEMDLVSARTMPSFEQRLAVLPDAIPAGRLQEIAAEVEALGGTERSFVPTHKKGGTVAYETLCEHAPRTVGLYLSPGFQRMISQIVGVDVVPTPLHDQNSCSVLFYERPGDHIGWHYDHNFYKGRHFTVLLPIVNRNASGDGVSAARLMARIGEEERVIETPPNRLVVFEGAKVLHKATPIAEGERRIVLSMTYATDPRNTLAQGVARRIKDTAFFGVRALWT